MTTSQHINQRLNGPSPLCLNRATRMNVYGVDDAILVSSIAATAASAGMGVAAQEQAAGAQRSAANAELMRQREYQDKAQAVANQSLQDSTRDVADEQIQAGTNQRLAAYQRVGGLAAPAAASPNQFATQPNSQAARAAESASSAKQLAAAWNKIVAPSQARSGGYGDWGLKQDQKNTRANEQIAMQGNAAHGSELVSRYELQQAGHAGDTTAGIGSALGALGSVGGMYAATRRAPVKPRIPGASIPGSTWNKTLSQYPVTYGGTVTRSPF